MRDGWRETALGEMLTQTQRPVVVAAQDVIPYAGLHWYAGGVYKRNEANPIKVKTRTLNRLVRGDITYNRMWATKAAFGVVDPDTDGCLVSNDFPVFRASEDVLLPTFISLVFSQPDFQRSAAALATGTTERRRLKESDFLGILVLLPPLHEQRRIVDLIEAVDKAIEAAERVNATVSMVLQSMLEEEWIQSTGALLPARVIAGLNFNRSFHDGDWIETKDQDMPPKGEVRLLQLADIGKGEFLNKSNRWISNETFNRLRCTQVYPGDILISRMAEPVGRSCIVPDLPYRMVAAVDCAICRMDKTVGIADYWNSMFMSSTWLAACNDLSSGSTRSRITRRNLESVGIFLPPLEEQQKKATDFRSLIAVMRTSASTSVQLEALRSALLADLLSGNHEIPTSYDQLLSV